MISLKRPFRNPVRLMWPDGRSELVKLVSIGKSGGAGEIFAIEGQPHLLAKLYHTTTPKVQLAHYEEKIRWMIGNRPELPPIPPEYAGIVPLAWPIAQITSASGFSGFVMEKIDFARTMELDYLLTRRQAREEGFEADFGKLVTVCCNLASLIQCLHSKKIAVVDLKPINLKVYKSELYVSILDCDGFYIQSDKLVCDAPQVTPEYLAPEFHGRAVTDPLAQDRFALATIIFRLLNYGIHPFAGISAGREPYPAELSGRIKFGLYPYGQSAHRDVRAAPGSVHGSFPDSIRELFDRSFSPMASGRAGASEWAALLATFASHRSEGMSRCAQGHLQFADKSCATCLRENILQGHVERQKRFVTRLRTTPARAVGYVRKTLKGTRTSPFQATLAQTHFTLTLAPTTLSIRNALSVEILWTIGLLVTYWWLK